MCQTDGTFYNFLKPSKSIDRRLLCALETSIVKFWYPGNVKCLFGNLNPLPDEKDKKGKALQNWAIWPYTPYGPFHTCRASKSGDRRIIYYSGTWCDGFWSSKVVKGSVGQLRSEKTKNNKSWKMKELLKSLSFQAALTFSLCDGSLVFTFFHFNFPSIFFASLTFSCQICVLLLCENCKKWTPRNCWRM